MSLETKKRPKLGKLVGQNAPRKPKANIVRPKKKTETKRKCFSDTVNT